MKNEMKGLSGMFGHHFKNDAAQSFCRSLLAAPVFVILAACSAEEPAANNNSGANAELASARVALCKSVVAYYAGKHTVADVDQSMQGDTDAYERVALSLAMQNALGTAMAGSASCDYSQTSDGVANKPFRITIGNTVHDAPATVAEMITLPEDFGLEDDGHGH